MRDLTEQGLARKHVAQALEHGAQWVEDARKLSGESRRVWESARDLHAALTVSQKHLNVVRSILRGERDEVLHAHGWAAVEGWFRFAPQGSPAHRAILAALEARAELKSQPCARNALKPYEAMRTALGLLENRITPAQAAQLDVTGIERELLDACVEVGAQIREHGRKANVTNFQHGLQLAQDREVIDKLDSEIRTMNAARDADALCHQTQEAEVRTLRERVEGYDQDRRAERKRVQALEDRVKEAERLANAERVTARAVEISRDHWKKLADERRHRNEELVSRVQHLEAQLAEKQDDEERATAPERPWLVEVNRLTGTTRAYAPIADGHYELRYVQREGRIFERSVSARDIYTERAAITERFGHEVVEVPATGRVWIGKGTRALYHEQPDGRILRREDGFWVAQPLSREAIDEVSGVFPVVRP